MKNPLAALPFAITLEEDPSRTSTTKVASVDQGPPLPAASSLLARAVHTICESRDDVTVDFIQPHGAGLKLGKKAEVYLFLWDEARAQNFPPALKKLMKQNARGMLIVGLVGGSKPQQQLLKKARPMMTEVKVGQVHIDDDGAVWTRDAKPIEKALTHFSSTPPPSEATWANLLEQGAEGMAESNDKAREMATFSAALRTRRPLATYSLISLILIVYGLEAVFGGTQSAIVLLRMGALDPDRVLEGEIWRLFSCTFLHAGFWHLLFNTYVLYALGSFLERFLGTWRFLLLYGLACLGASLTSMMFLEGFSVGASGGLWGLLGADAVLAWRSKGLLPRAIIQGARKAAKFNLGINLLNSFRPQVDMWAHFGGGAVGAVLMLSGLITRGLPRLGELESQNRANDPEATEIPTGPGLKLAASLITGLLVLGLALGLGNGRPWQLQQPLVLVQTPIPELGIALALPPKLEQVPDPETELSVAVGDLSLDLGSAVVTLYPGDFTAGPRLEGELAALVEQMKTAPEAGRLVSGPEELTIADSPGVIVRFAYENGLEEEIAFVFLEDVLVKANTLRWPSFHKAVAEGYAARVLEGLERLPAAASSTSEDKQS